MKRLLALIVLPLLIAGCSKKSTADCGKVAAHFIELVRQELAKDGSSEEQEKARANLPTLQSALLETCEESGWSEGVRSCILAAKTAAQTEECDPSQAKALSSDAQASD